LIKLFYPIYQFWINSLFFVRIDKIFKIFFWPCQNYFFFENFTCKLKWNYTWVRKDGVKIFVLSILWHTKLKIFELGVWVGVRVSWENWSAKFKIYKAIRWFMHTKCKFLNNLNFFDGVTKFITQQFFCKNY